MTPQRFLHVLLLAAALPALTWAQSSSLYLRGQPEQRPRRETIKGTPVGHTDRLSPTIAAASFSAVPMPDPRTFSLHDLVTIIIRESVENNTSQTLETTKDLKYDGAISDFPRLQLGDLFNARVEQNATTLDPKLGVKFKSDFEGGGKARRTDTFTTRITARVIDIKPNGTMVLEARKHIASDKEVTDLVLTGVCRKEDVAADNTILSTQLYDMHLTRESSGEVRKSARKGIITKVLDTIFNF